MDENDDVLKIRLPSGLKDELEEIARRDPDTPTLSAWTRRELKAGLKISRRKLEED